MTIKWEKVHIFISSTFNDMHAERDYLVKRVFPDLREWCEQRKLRLVDIDLRWGVTEADASSKRAVKVCLERINICRPFFLCLLGQRHGWTLSEEGISADTFEEFPELREALHPAASVTELEIRHAIFRPFASRNPENPNRLIQYEPAKHAFFYIRDQGYLKELSDSPRQLLCAYTDDAGPEDETEEERQMRGLSIDALQSIRRDISRHDISRTATHQPVTYSTSWRRELGTPELAMPLECPFQDDASRRRWQSTWNRFAHLSLAEADSRVSHEKQGAANDYNSVLTGGRLSGFRSLKEARDQFPAGTELARIIQHDLQRAILERYPDRKEVPETSDLQREIDQHEEFISNSVEGFIERGNDFAELDDYVGSDSNKLFILTAAGGIGKSTLLANWVDRYRTTIEARPDHSTHFRFIGQSDESSTVYSLLRTLLREIKEVAGKLDEEIPDDPVKLRNTWPQLLDAIGKRGKTVIIIDALNQLESGLSDLNWIPQRLPDDIKIIASFKRDDQTSEEVYRRLEESGQAILSEVKPFEDEEDRRRLVRAYLSQYLKELDERDLETLIRLRGASNPLYLKVVLSELRVFGVFGNLAEKIHDGFGDTPVSAFVGVLNRLENDPAYSPIDPTQALPLLFGLLAHARHGLSVDELTSLLVQTLGLEDCSESREDAADTINLFLRQVRRFMARRGGRHAFFFESFKVAAQERYVAKSSVDHIPKPLVTDWHRMLADYFYGLPTWHEIPISSQAAKPTHSRQPTRRKVAELPFHLTQAEEWDKLEETLCDLHFIEAKSAAGMVYDLQTDYEAALDALPEAQKKKAEEHAHEQQVARYTRELIAYAKSWSDARDRHAADPGNNPMPKDEDIPLPIMITSIEPLSDDLMIQVPSVGTIWNLTRLDRMRAFSVFVALESHSFSRFATMAGFCLQQAYNYASAGPVVHAAEQILQSAGEQRMLLRNANTRGAYNPHPDMLRILEGHTSWVTSVSITPDGRIAASGGGGLDKPDGTVRVWDLETGGCLRILVGHTGAVEAVSITPDAKTVVSGSADQTVRVWDVTTGQCRRVLEGHKDTIKSVSITPDGKIAVSWGDKTIRVWDLVTGQELRAMEEPTVFAGCAGITPDGRRAISGGRAGLSVWDLETGRCLRTLADTMTSNTISITPDCRKAITGVSRNLCVWTLDTGQCLYLPENHPSPISSVSSTPDGKVALASAGGTILIWNVSTGRCLRTLRAPTFINSISLTPDGKTAVSGDRAGRLRVWNVATGHTTHSRRLGGGYTSCVSLSLDGKTAVFSYGHAFLDVWDVDSEDSLRMLSGYTGLERDRMPIFTVDLSPDGDIAVSGGVDAFRIWDVVTGQCLARLGGYLVDVTCIRLTPDGKMAVLGASTLSVWDLATGECLRTLEGHEYPVVTCVSVTPDGRTAVSGGFDKTLRVWNLSTGECLRILKGHTGYVLSVCLTPDGKTAISGSGDHYPHLVVLRDEATVSGRRDYTLRVWDISTGECLRILQGHTAAILSVSVTRDGKTAVSGSDDQTVRVWDLATGQCVAIFYTAATVLSLSAVRTAGRLCIGTANGVVFATLHGFKFNTLIVTPVRLWLSGTSKGNGRWDERLTTVCEYCGQRFEPTLTVLDAIQSISEHLTPNQSPCLELPAEAWDDQRLLSQCPHCHQHLKFNPFIVDALKRDTRIRPLRLTPTGHTTPGESINGLWDSKIAASGSTDETLPVWDVTTKECLRVIEAHEDAVQCVALTPNGQMCVTGSADNTLRVWIMETGEWMRTLEGHMGGVWSLSLTPYDPIIVSGGADRELRVRDVNMARCRRILKGHTSSVRTISLTPDGKTVVSGSNDGTLRVWDLASGQCRLTIEGRMKPVVSTSITPDGKVAVSGSADHTLRVWDLSTGQCLHTLKGHTGAVMSVRVAPDGKTIVSGSEDQTSRVWDLRTGQCRHTLHGHTHSILGVSLTPDGKTVVSGGMDKTLRVWDLNSEQCIAIFQAPGIVRCVSEVRKAGQLCFGTDSGLLVHVSLDSFEFGPPLTTLTRLWFFGESDTDAHWEDRLTAFCEHCDARFEPTPSVRDAIRSITARLTPRQSPCLELPPEAWDEPRLLSECTYCHEPVRFNPFMVDNRDQTIINDIRPAKRIERYQEIDRTKKRWWKFWK